MKSKNQFVRVTAAALLSMGVAALSGCGKDLKQATQEPRLMKVWEGQCATSDLLRLSVKPYFKFSGSEYKEVHTFYSEANCVGEAVDLTYRGEFTIRDEVAGARKVDFRFDHVEVTALNQKGKDTLEAVKFCGTPTWELGKNVVLDGKTGGVTCPLRTVPTGEFNIYAFENEKLFLGKAGLRGGPTKEADRPTSVDRDQVFVPSGRNL